MTVTAAAGTPLAALQDAALERGLWVPLGLPGGDETVGERLDHLLARPVLLSAASARDVLLESWSRLGDGRLLHAGAPVFKNVAGYHLAHLLCGSGGTLAEPLGATFQLKPAPQHLLACRWRLPDTSLGGVDDLLRRLADRDPVLGGANAFAETDADGITLGALAPGRDRSWDLQSLSGELRALAAAHSWTEVEAGIGEIRSTGSVAAEIPAWVTASDDWQALTPERAAPDCILPDALPRRWWWQAAPRILFTPEAAGPVDGWYVDVTRRGGEATPLPAPAAEVPLALLRSIKRVFDPGGALPAPGWLTEATDV